VFNLGEYMKRKTLDERCAELKERIQRKNFDPPPSPSPTKIATGEAKPLSVKDVAERLGMSAAWVRKHFRTVPGVLALPSAGPNTVGKQSTLIIPEDVFERELEKFKIKPDDWAKRKFARIKVPPVRTFRPKLLKKTTPNSQMEKECS
jgi:AraC-like DNA-binding protein